MIAAPASRSSSGVTLFTVACVPTGIKMGVGIKPCGVVTTPARAHVSGHSDSIVKENADIYFYKRRHDGARRHSSSLFSLVSVFLCFIFAHTSTLQLFPVPTRREYVLWSDVVVVEESSGTRFPGIIAPAMQKENFTNDGRDRRSEGGSR